MMVDLGKNIVYGRHKFVGGLDMNDFSTKKSPRGRQCLDTGKGDGGEEGTVLGSVQRCC